MIKISENIKRLIERAKDKINIPLYQLEKDYLLTMILRELVKRDNNIVFKGGTCLSKAYKVIERFSEDIDITYLASYSKERKEYGVSGKQRLEINNLVEEVVKKYDFEIIDDIRDASKKEMNYKNKRREFKIKYNNVYSDVNIIKIDSSYITPTIEYNTKEILPMLCEILGINVNTGTDEEAETLTKFKIKVEKEEQIIADKFFALSKHLKLNEYENYSRHIYDIYKVTKNDAININDISKYVKETEKYENENAIKDKENGKKVEESDLKDVLLDVCSSTEYENDFVNNLQKDLLFTNEKNKISFEVCIKAIKDLIKKGVFDNIKYYFVLKRKTYLYKYDKKLKKAERYSLEKFIRNEFEENKAKAFEQWDKWKNDLENANKGNDEGIYKVCRLNNDTYIVAKGITESFATEIINKQKLKM